MKKLIARIMLPFLSEQSLRDIFRKVSLEIYTRTDDPDKLGYADLMAVAGRSDKETMQLVLRQLWRGELDESSLKRILDPTERRGYWSA